MTIIACDKVRGIMLADTLVSADENRAYAGIVTKIFRAPDGSIGGACGGAFRAGLFNRWVVGGMKGDPDSEWFEGDERAEGLVLTPDRDIMWYMCPMPERVTSNQHAIGYGYPYFMAATMAGADIHRAVDITCSLCGVCKPPITELILERRSKSKRQGRKS